jgi:cyclic pyranopterin phosphate synthase
MSHELSHVDQDGNARMVDVSGKPPVLRIARARGRIVLAAETARLIRENQIAKGDVLTVSRVAGISAAKRTPELIPLCHTFGLDHADVSCRLEETSVEIEATARCVGRTGVEMEALTAVSVAALTVYDMCKAVDKAMRIEDIALVEKQKLPVPGEGSSDRGS